MSLRILPSGLRLAAIETPDDTFSALTYPRYRAVLSGARLPEVRARRIAIGAWLDDAPVGLAYLSEPLPEQPLPEGRDDPAVAAAGHARQLMSVMVLPFLRRTGIGLALLAAGERQARASGTARLFALHSSQLAAREGYEALLRAAGWAAPRLHERRIVGKVAWVEKSVADWAPLQARWRAQGFSAAPWSSVGAAEREEIAALLRDEVPAAERSFDPLQTAGLEDIVPELSLLLRRHGRIVGWLFGSPGVPPNSIWYAQGYVLPALQRQGWLLAGMRDVCERQLRRMGPDSLCMFLTHGYNLPMQRIIARRFGPYADWVDSRYLAEKVLDAAAHAASKAQPASDSTSASSASDMRTRGWSQGVSATEGCE